MLPAQRPPHLYEPLPPGRDIRIIRLQPAKTAAAPIRFSLHVVSLDAPRHRYEALSYAWEGQIPDQPVECDGRVLCVTLTCLAALRRLRRTARTRTLWIDAICINQNSECERGYQVALMRDVYSVARQVIVWLGEGEVDGRGPVYLLFEILKRDRRLRLMSKLFDQFLLLHWTFSPSSRIQLNWDRGEERLAEMGFSFSWLSDFIPWLARLWTVQEIAFAQRAIVVYGSRTCKYEDFVVSLHRRMNSHARTGRRHIDQTKFLREVAFLNLREQACFLAQRTRQPFRADHSSNLLRFSVFGQSTDPEDKVFALHGLLQKVTPIPLPEPKYGLDPSLIYWKTCSSLLRSGRSLAFIEDVQPRVTMSKVPSWVPDLNRPVIGFNPSTIGTFDFHASQNSLSDYKLLHRDLLISTKACFVTKIEEIAHDIDLVTHPSQFKTLEDQVAGFFAVVRCYQRWIAFVAAKSGLYGSQIVDEIFPHYKNYRSWSRQDMADIVSLIHKADLSQLDAAAYITRMQYRLRTEKRHKEEPLFDMEPKSTDYQFDLSELLSPSETKTSHQGDIPTQIPRTWQTTVLVTAWDVCAGAGVFSTTDGYFGVAPAARQVGDVVTLIPGLNWPMLLRPLQNGHYRVVSAAYVNRIMGGQRWDESLLQPIVLE